MSINVIRRHPGPLDKEGGDGMNKAHGSPYDRGSADFWCWRPRAPHKYPNGTGRPPRIEEADMTADEIAEYHQGYDEAEACGEKERVVNHHDSDYDELRELGAARRAGADEVYCCSCEAYVIANPHEDDCCPRCDTEVHVCTRCNSYMFGELHVGEEFLCGPCAREPHLWEMYDRAADEVARRGGGGTERPDWISSNLRRVIENDPEAFERRVKECAYRQACLATELRTKDHVYDVEMD